MDRVAGCGARRRFHGVQDPRRKELKGRDGGGNKRTGEYIADEQEDEERGRVWWVVGRYDKKQQQIISSLRYVFELLLFKITGNLDNCSFWSIKKNTI